MNGFDISVITSNLPYLFWEGMKVTISLTILATIGGIALGTLLALARLSGSKILGRVAGWYVNLFRSLPLLLVIFWFYFLVPYVAGWVTGSPRPVAVGGYLSALITFTLFEAAYFSEIIRAGIQSLPKGQAGAAAALGMTYPQSLRYVILPQAFRNMLPVMLTQTIILFQDTSLVYVVSLTDFLGAASKIAQIENRMVEMYVFAALVYLVICFAASMLVKRLQARTTIIR
ncbi:amino acid ABC transporter permease [Brucella pseudogrignonensis]|uniref:amino acid ABC transporter permease n=1 Tax=Brucella pseudogrignonensis TaxID=419475 RepID=UPI0007DA68B8|nr:ABC transporter permease subunit [Brucella pseudogrignonensis]ANG98694.1 amino acid ABC transporter permease [Brucella pseudogrignonensis]